MQPGGSPSASWRLSWLLASIEETLQPGAFVTPHTHANDVWVYVLSGTVGVLVGNEIGEAGAGEWALKPRNVPHASGTRRTSQPDSSRC